ncbi:glycoside hydrolase family 2 protein [Clostridium sp. E02]|uniref:beta-mannosidase n=1 Tax=Clostridium sp. E02 TaxID=2487134 RepID=UPI000F5260AC|nr:glycoside hydrolase family 2 protein [Clostridium sp. E02]
MQKVEMKDIFKMRIKGTDQWHPAKVPGSVYTDLLNNKAMSDPFWRDQEEMVLSLMEEEFEYLGVFDVSPSMLEEEKNLLHFDGLDTLAEIELNGVWLGSVNNMHRTYEFVVTNLLRMKDNELRILFHSPTKYIEKEYQKEPIGGSEDAMRGFSRLRKAHCMFGWDWGPRLPDAGICRGVYLLGFTYARLDQVYITQRHQAEGVYLDFQVDLKLNQKDDLLTFVKDQKELKRKKYSYQVTVTEPDEEGKQCVYEHAPETILLTNPKLWWPNGFGKQNLYHIRVVLLKEGKEIDAWENHIGLRTMTIHRETDEYGESFAHEVNGITIFAMGADYIPEDNLRGRCNPKRTKNLLLQCKAANYNMIRVWGGGYYPDDYFYQICDQLGFIVWQDLMFACANYDLTEAFEETVFYELVDNIRRIRHHACLGLWCGNNEMEQFTALSAWNCTPKQKADYIKLFEYIIPKILNKEDPQTFYWPASPSSGGSFDSPNDETRGDVHYWDVWHGNKPFTEYRKFYFRYLSEFGFQSFPSYRTIETFTEEKDRNVFSYIMEKHQRNAQANGKIMGYLGQTFLYPTDFDVLLYASQLLQAEAMKYGVEHFRRNRGRCMGTIIWQLNDCWPAVSWSSIDYCGRWKALHYYEKRFFAPLLISCEEAVHTCEVETSIRLSLANESRFDETVTASWQLTKNTGEIIRKGQEKRGLKKLSSLWLDPVMLPEANIHEDYVSYQMEREGEIVSFGTVLFCAPKHYNFLDPELTVRAEADTIIVRSKAYAKSIEIRNRNDDLILSDNFFDMNPGERQVKIWSGIPEDLTVRSVYDIR